MTNNMCGILLTHKHKASPVDHIVKMYKQQTERGTDGFGVVLGSDNRIDEVIRHTTDKILHKLRDKKANLVMFHHRFPTSTPNVIESTHPIKVQLPNSKHRYYVIHNGHITNHDALYDDHKTMGFQYSSAMNERKLYTTVGRKEYFVDEGIVYNDSEALAYDLALYLEDRQVVLKSRGTIAFVALKTDLKNNILAIYFGRNTGSPLYCRHTDKSLALASTSIAISNGVAGDNIFPVQTDTLFTYDIRDGSLSTKPLTVPEYSSYSTYHSPVGYGYQKYDRSGYDDTDLDKDYDKYSRDKQENKMEMYDELFNYFDEGYGVDELRNMLQQEYDTLSETLGEDYQNDEAWGRLLELQELLDNVSRAYEVYATYYSELPINTIK